MITHKPGADDDEEEGKGSTALRLCLQGRDESSSQSFIFPSSFTILFKSA